MTVKQLDTSPGAKRKKCGEGSRREEYPHGPATSNPVGKKSRYDSPALSKA